MDIKNIFQQIQSVKDTNPVIVLGSGASVSYGIPSMWTLADAITKYFNAHPFTDEKAKEAIKSFLSLLANGKGLEESLLEVKVPKVVEESIVRVVWDLISESDQKAFIRFQSGEKVNLKIFFDHIIYGDPSKVVNVVSTNYDKIAEYAACQTKAYVNIGFTNGLIGCIKEDVFSRPKKMENDYTGVINVLKVHGSLDWFEKDGNIYNYPNTKSIPTGFTPCIITPGTNKYERTQQEPYRQIFSAIDKVFANSNGFVCLGYGFNDQHVHPMLLKSARNKKTKILIVTKEITESIKTNVMNCGFDYIAVYSDGANGTVFQTPSDNITVSDHIYWTIDGILEI
jgi:hypothetical protein